MNDSQQLLASAQIYLNWELGEMGEELVRSLVARIQVLEKEVEEVTKRYQEVSRVSSERGWELDIVREENYRNSRRETW